MGGYRVSDEQKKIAYYYAKKMLTSQGQFTIGNAVKETCRECNMNENSANIFIRTIIKMFNGEGYGRGIGGLSTKFLFDNFYKDFGKDTLTVVLCSTLRHIAKYRELKENDTRTINQRRREKQSEETLVLEYAERYGIDISKEYQQLKSYTEVINVKDEILEN